MSLPVIFVTLDSFQKHTNQNGHKNTNNYTKNNFLALRQFYLERNHVYSDFMLRFGAISIFFSRHFEKKIVMF